MATADREASDLQIHSLRGVDCITFSHRGRLPDAAVERIKAQIEAKLPGAVEAGIPILVLEEGSRVEFHRPISVEILEELRKLNASFDELLRFERRRRTAA